MRRVDVKVKVVLAILTLLPCQNIQTNDQGGLDLFEIVRIIGIGVLTQVALKVPDYFFTYFFNPEANEFATIAAREHKLERQKETLEMQKMVLPVLMSQAHLFPPHLKGQKVAEINNLIAGYQQNEATFAKNKESFEKFIIDL